MVLPWQPSHRERCRKRGFDEVLGSFPACPWDGLTSLLLWSQTCGGGALRHTMTGGSWAIPYFHGASLACFSSGLPVRAGAALSRRGGWGLAQIFNYVTLELRHFSRGWLDDRLWRSRNRFSEFVMAMTPLGEKWLRWHRCIFSMRPSLVWHVWYLTCAAQRFVMVFARFFH